MISNKLDNLEIGEQKTIKYKTLISVLCSDRTAREILEEAEEMYGPESAMYIRGAVVLMGYWSDLTRITPLYTTLEELLEARTPPSTMVALPEAILLPLLSDLDNVVKKWCVRMCRSAIHRHLGDLYRGLYVYYRRVEGETGQAAEECHHKAVRYYTEGMEMAYGANFGDRGLGGYVRLATFYYLNGEAERLEETLQQLDPVLEWARGVDVINYLENVKFNIKAKYNVLPWKSDQLFYQNLIEACDEIFLEVHPVCLAYYIKAMKVLGIIYIDSSEGTEINIHFDVPLAQRSAAVEQVHQILALMKKMFVDIKPMILVRSLGKLILIVRFVMHKLEGQLERSVDGFVENM